MTLAISQESEQLLRLAQERSKQSIDSILHEAIMRYLEDIEDEQSARESEPNAPTASSDELARQAGIMGITISQSL